MASETNTLTNLLSLGLGIPNCPKQFAQSLNFKFAQTFYVSNLPNVLIFILQTGRKKRLKFNGRGGGKLASELAEWGFKSLRRTSSFWRLRKICRRLHSLLFVSGTNVIKLILPLIQYSPAQALSFGFKYPTFICFKVRLKLSKTSFKWANPSLFFGYFRCFQQ